jgi:hypothetical protein
MYFPALEEIVSVLRRPDPIAEMALPLTENGR